MIKNPERAAAAKQLRETTDKLPDKAIDRLLGYAEGIAADARYSRDVLRVQSKIIVVS